MDLSQDNVIGIVGGMGPQAGLALYNSILSQTKAGCDQEHLSAILMSFPSHLGDRTAFLEGKTAVNPAFTIAGIIGLLEKAGARIAGIACNTSHAPPIYDVIREELDRINSSILLLNMPYETCRYVKDEHPAVRRIGLMATNGTYRSGIYSRELYNLGLEAVLPDVQFQNDVIHRMIYDPVFGLKSTPAGVDRRAGLLAERALHYFKKKGADVIILGCTDLSLLQWGAARMDMLIVDSNEAMARALIRKATGLQVKRKKRVSQQ